MFHNILEQSKINVFVNNDLVEVSDIKDDLQQLTADCYLAPCMAIADDSTLNKVRQMGVWIEITLPTPQTYKDFEFKKLLINIYPKHDFLVMHRFLDNKYQGKSITINLMYKTTNLYKKIINTKG